MAEATVLGTGEDEICKAELSYVPQPLDRPTLDDRRLEIVGSNVVVNRIAECERHHRIVAGGLWGLRSLRHRLGHSLGAPLGGAASPRKTCLRPVVRRPPEYSDGLLAPENVPTARLPAHPHLRTTRPPDYSDGLLGQGDDLPSWGRYASL